MFLLPLLYLLKWSNLIHFNYFFQLAGWKTNHHPPFSRWLSGHHGAFIPQLFRLRPQNWSDWDGLEVKKSCMMIRLGAPQGIWKEVGDIIGIFKMCCTLCFASTKNGDPKSVVLKWNPNIDGYEFAVWPCEHGFCVHTNHGSGSVMVAGVILCH